MERLSDDGGGSDDKPKDDSSVRQETVCMGGGGGVYIAHGLVISSNTAISSIPRANSLINWQCTLTSMAVWFKISPSQFQLL